MSEIKRLLLSITKEWRYKITQVSGTSAPDPFSLSAENLVNYSFKLFINTWDDNEETTTVNNFPITTSTLRRNYERL